MTILQADFPRADVPQATWVELPAFRGTLLELASALRSGRVPPEDVPLLDLTRRVLARVEALRAAQPDAACEVLPLLAGVIALKAKLLLPPAPTPEDFDDEGEGDFSNDVTSGVETLADLDALVSFLQARRVERAGVVAARPLDLGLPRRERKAPPGTLAKLVKAARAAVRDVTVPLLAHDRTTLRDALVSLRAYATRLRRFVFGAITVHDWAERTTYFTALLEGVKDGEFEVTQEAPFGPIEVETRSVRDDAHEPDVRAADATSST
ncbi:segregation and condensation protein A [Deinococcus yavapaiensis]|uniref:Condensin subunit ScpA n=1 Tax=Deinococcus yavapaiensis KR-236 TaxID=694435 RepID=A0A318S4A7_9DEIO|nr:ScpA family protein [Deinococcus yavapaiensis]PYE52900.1 condensin subunit ScpA [Deinococcus yavapaiensis KR-236]